MRTSSVLTRTRLAAVSFCAAALSVPLGTPPAHAVLVPWHTVTVTSAEFTPSEIYITEGDSLFLVNADPSMQDHNITSVNGAFATPNLSFGGRAEVPDVSSLRASVYPFVCTIHDDVMVGNLNVVALVPAR